MTTFVALYRGLTVAEAKLLAVSADANLVGLVASPLLTDSIINSDESDPVLRPVQQGRQRALRIVARQSEPTQTKAPEGVEEGVEAKTAGGDPQ